jgi:phthalate 4,5-cis-dihydrodiol dehydrogenase
MTQNSADSKPIGLGIVGLGMAGAVMVHAAAAHPDFVLAAAADPHPGPREAFVRDHKTTRAYEDVRMLVRDPAVQVVYIATPHQFHAEHAALAAE